ncbi:MULTISPECIES: nicotinate-nucleotide adenylyltransferase [unclassified Chamaesiphon]|uniref:nicotinate-nucleotide adenylyltransferase n=1 Tax=unclassified Chamaesiphon TaxID=2620921 RepID=UPI002869FEBD|nr:MULTISPECIES: nicotinate-nucleotide adenylyltransferase [unclassified Chamaesiphon]
MKIALFGTSADPPTIAHQEIIRWLASQFDLVAVWAADNPFKAHGASLEQRSQMLELSIAEIEPPIDRHVKVYRNLSSRRTFESLATAREIWQDSEFILTIGADLIAQLPQWYRANELLTQVKLLIVPRTGNQIELTDLQRLTDLGAQIAIAPLSTPIISSTAIRNSHSIHGMTPSVAKYIQQHNLYSIIYEPCDRATLK